MVSIYFVKFARKYQLWALRQMAFAHKHLHREVSGSFYKLLGSGAGNGFSIWPDWSTFCLVVFWKEDTSYDKFSQLAGYWSDYCARGSEVLEIQAIPTKVIGTWGGICPIDKVNRHDDRRPMAVLTRATIKPWRVPYFWTQVPAASKHIEKYPGHLLSKGVGEWPLFMQATVSVWDNKKAMQTYAYQSDQHRKMIHKTRKLGWYKEEMFSQYNVLQAKGIWEGEPFIIE